MTSRLRLTTIAILAWILSACSPPAEPPAGEAVASVETAAAVTGDLAITVVGYGTIEFDPAGQTNVNTEVEGRVAEILVQPGAQVLKGQLMMRLVPSAASGLAITRVRADFDAANAELARQKRLRADGLVSDADVERAALVARDLIAQSDALQRSVGEVREIRAADAFVVDAVTVAQGQLAPAGTVLLRLAKPGVMQARINLELEDAVRLATGDMAHIEGLDGGTQLADAAISAVDSRINVQTRMASALIPVPSSSGLMPGEAIRASAIADIRKNVLIIPRAAVFTDEQGDFVFVAIGGVAERRNVNTGDANGDLIEIKAGLSAGDSVVTNGGAILSDGMKLTVRPAANVEPAGTHISK